MLDTPVLFIMFNRPESTKAVFEQIKLAQPKQLFLAADGPRDNHPEDIRKCILVKELAMDITWDCEVKTLFRERNLGCGKAVSTAINWFFEHVDEGIILEDDCLPSLDFFHYCAELLREHRNNEQVMHITGTNYNDNLKFGTATYYSSKYPHIWGWATWKRAWKFYDFELEDVNYYQALIKRLFSDPYERKFWQSRIHLIKEKIVNTWDYQWMFSIWAANGLCLNPNHNFIINLGFSDASTHTKGNNPYIEATLKPLSRVVHPTNFEINNLAEINFIKQVHGIVRLGYIRFYLQRLLNLIDKAKKLSVQKSSI